jgi:quinol monooxygenase YgiN
MSYEKVITYTKTSESPADAFLTMPVLPSVATAEQIEALNSQYPMTWDQHIVLDQLVMHNVFPSKEDYDARNAAPIIKALQEKRTAWVEANHLVVDFRVL